MTNVIIGILTDETLRKDSAVETLLMSEANIAEAWGSKQMIST